MGEIAVKLRDAASMFWQSLDEQERRLLLIGGLYFAFTVYSIASEKKREWERDEIVSRVTDELERRGRH